MRDGAVGDDRVGDQGAEEPAGPGSARVEALSDAIIAIAATLLVIELAVPAAGADVGHALLEEVPAFLAYGVSFLTILIFWVNHHALFGIVRRVDRPLLFLNGLVLLGISFISYPTATLGRALQAGVHDRAAAVFYAAVLCGTASAFTGIWCYLRFRPRLLSETARGAVQGALRRSLAGPGAYAIAALVGAANAALGLALCALVAAYFTLAPRRPGRAGAA
ncbi:TMEM175 family protein [Micromonospora sp. NPDC050980]|uniref:TMEM175 family protein n=1 Tax=Micromonospora sp. NPDC050980 TaxID=3155161 RepID=UPI0033F04F6E